MLNTLQLVFKDIQLLEWEDPHIRLTKLNALLDDMVIATLTESQRSSVCVKTRPGWWQDWRIPQPIQCDEHALIQLLQHANVHTFEDIFGVIREHYFIKKDDDRRTKTETREAFISYAQSTITATAIILVVWLISLCLPLREPTHDIFTAFCIVSVVMYLYYLVVAGYYFLDFSLRKYL